MFNCAKRRIGMNFQRYVEIAGVKIRVLSKDKPFEEEKTTSRRFASFVKKGMPKKIDIDSEIKAVSKLPGLKGKKILFKVKRNPQNYDWMLSKRKGKFILDARMGETYTAIFNKDFSIGKIYIKIAKNASSWKMSQLIYGPLQIVLMNYLAKYKLGVLIHSSGINYKGKGFLFVAQTRFGKSTSARLWSKRKGVVILNDDRIILKKTKKGIYLFGTPWHGDFSDYVDTISSSVPLKRLFFIYHLKKNLLKPLNSREAFNRFFPNTFPIFWDKEDMLFTIDFLYEVIGKIPAFSLGFINDDRVIDYVLNHERNKF